MPAKILTEQPNAASERIDRMSVEEMLRVINSEDKLVAEAVASCIPAIAKAVGHIAAALRGGGRLFYIGAGTSGRLGVLDAAECAPTYNVPAHMVQGIIAGGESALARATEASEDDPVSGVHDLRQREFSAQDVLCGIAASGRTPYVLGAMDEARRLGARTIGISCVPDSELSRRAEIAITPVTGPEVITGSTRMKAGTATKLVLNMLSTGVMIRLGYTYGNLMVNVQPKNVKLEDRARRIIAKVTGAGDERAAELLEASGRCVRTAIVMEKTGLDREHAEAQLLANGNVVAKALGELE
ncbi:MAG: N-acetylmuramic acid 6-phosphate etherase [Candidatus Solibacter usitatus]|nr:N-acetylmuramic acid 6-phosphate etherase [Candidatus Solibacter usitatus]